MTGGSSMLAMIWTVPPHFGQVSTSIRNTRLRCVGTGVGGDDALDDRVEHDVVGQVHRQDAAAGRRRREQRRVRRRAAGAGPWHPLGRRRSHRGQGRGHGTCRMVGCRHRSAHAPPLSRCGARRRAHRARRSRLLRPRAGSPTPSPSRRASPVSMRCCASWPRRPRCEAASVRPLCGQRPPSQPTTGATKPQIQAMRKPTARVAPTTENRVFRRRPCGATPIGGTAGGAAAPGAVNGSAPAGAEAPVGRRGASAKTGSANTVGSPRYSVVQAASLRVLGRLLRPALRRGRRIR